GSRDRPPLLGSAGHGHPARRGAGGARRRSPPPRRQPRLRQRTGRPAGRRDRALPAPRRAPAQLAQGGLSVESSPLGASAAAPLPGVAATPMKYVAGASEIARRLAKGQARAAGEQRP